MRNLEKKEQVRTSTQNPTPNRHTRNLKIGILRRKLASCVFTAVDNLVRILERFPARMAPKYNQ